MVLFKTVVVRAWLYVRGCMRLFSKPVVVRVWLYVPKTVPSQKHTTTVLSKTVVVRAWLYVPKTVEFIPLLEKDNG